MTRRTVTPEYPGAKLSTEQGCCSLVTKSCLTCLQPHELYSQTPLSMGFIRQESWSELPFPSPRDFPDPGIKPASCLASGFFTIEQKYTPLLALGLQWDTLYLLSCFIHSQLAMLLKGIFYLDSSSPKAWRAGFAQSWREKFDANIFENKKPGGYKIFPMLS